jgi:peptidylprolyl isomerase
LPAIFATAGVAQANLKGSIRLKLVPIIGVALAGALLIIVGAGGAIWYTGQAAGTGPAIAEAGDAVRVAEGDVPDARRGAERIELDTLRQLLQLVEATRSDAILESTEVFARFVEQERANQAVLTAAYANDADRNAAVATLMLRASQKVLAEAYLTQVVRRNLDEGFPNEAQTREYYDANTESFRLPERVHVWQVFIPAPAAASATVRTNAKALAAQVATALAKGQSSFKEAANRHSKHLQSQVNDGYMGLLKLDDLLPEVKTAIEALKIDAISDPVQSQAGFHILKRGAIVARQQLDYDAVRERIVAQLRRDAAAQVRQAALRKILETYPVAVDADSLEPWRADLQSATWPASVR